MKPWFQSEDQRFTLYHGDCVAVMRRLAARGAVRLVATDPPYYLSRAKGTTCKGGKRVAVSKGEWDHKEMDTEEMHRIHRRWLRSIQELLHPDGTCAISGTHHMIHSVGYAMQELGFRLLNDLIWEKPAPPPNLSCRFFTHASETIIWAAREQESDYVFNDGLMRERYNRGKQMRSVWRVQRASSTEMVHGKHPTQKPEGLYERIVLAASHQDELVVDPFCGSGTTGIAAVRFGRPFIGIDQSEDYLCLARSRYLQLQKQTSKEGRNGVTRRAATAGTDLQFER